MKIQILVAVLLVAATSCSAWSQSCSDYSWSALPSEDGVGFVTECGGSANCLAEFDPGDGKKLYVGIYTGCGDGTGPVLGVWDGNTLGWIASPLYTAPAQMVVADIGDGEKLYILTVNYKIWSWDGEHWADLSLGSSAFGIYAYHDSDRDYLIVHGQSNGVYIRENGSWVSMLPDGVSGNIEAATTVATQDGPKFFMLGNFSDGRMATFDGQSMEFFCSNPDGNVMDRIGSAKTIVQTELEGVPSLMIGGRSAAIGNPIYLFDYEALFVDPEYADAYSSKAWVPMGSGVDGEILSHAKADIAGETVHFFSGTLTRAGKHVVRGIARWDSSGWSSTGADFYPNYVNGIASYDDGTGNGIYAVGVMEVMGATRVNSIAKYSASGPPIINLNPESTGAEQGQPVSFTTEAKGYELQFQWRFEGQDIQDGPDVTGANSATLTLLDPQFEDSGSYSALVENPCGSSESLSANLLVSVLGDLNYDGRVNGGDLGIMLGYWGNCPPQDLPCPPDFDDNGFIDGGDLGLLLLAWTG